MRFRIGIGIMVLTSLIGVYVILKGSINQQNMNNNFSPKQIIDESNPTVTSQATYQPPPVCRGILTPALSEGPYYKPDAPVRTNIRGNAEGEKLTLSGYVFDSNCAPVVNALLDFWQADAQGRYDLQGYEFRGRQYTNGEGQYKLDTVVPARYTGRTTHIHVKVQANGDSPAHTTQLYFPGENQNRNDSIFDPDLVMDTNHDGDVLKATFDFVIQAK